VQHTHSGRRGYSPAVDRFTQTRHEVNQRSRPRIDGLLSGLDAFELELGHADSLGKRGTSLPVGPSSDQRNGRGPGVQRTFGP
jgi:hypothetical protein